jgi:putative ABC transport system substrate-binding protein
MNGTWQGTFSGTNTGEIVVEIDDVGDHFRGCAYAYDKDAALPSTFAVVPIVFAIGDDPVKWGIVANLAHPNSNATGVNFFTSEVLTKRLELLHDLLPGAVRIAVLLNSADAKRAKEMLSELRTAARSLGLEIQVLYASTQGEIDAAFPTMARERPDALFVGPDSFFNNRRVQLVMLAARHAIPTVFAVREYVDAGGLMSYGTSVTEFHRQVGVYAGRILKGARPADLPVMQSVKFELVINLQTARMLGLERAVLDHRAGRRRNRINS